MPELTRQTEMTLGNRTITAGEELRLAGERGRYRFLSYVSSSAGSEWVDLWGPNNGHAGHRSVTVDRVRVIGGKR